MTVWFWLNKRARVSFVFEPKPRGRGGSFALVGHRGENKVLLPAGSLRSAKLESGRYRLLITATNSAGQRSRHASLIFTMLN